VTQSQARGKWLFLSVLTLVAGGLGAFAIWAFAIRGDEGGPEEGAAAPLSQSEVESLGRFHLLAWTDDVAFAGTEIERTCAEVTAIVESTPFSPYDTSAYPGFGAEGRWSPLPNTAHWAAAADLEALAWTGRVLRPTGLRSILESKDEVDGYGSALRDCYDSLLPALEAATGA
jgi:hypothetical protein